MDYATSSAQRRPERESHANALTLTVMGAANITVAIAPAQLRQRVKLASWKATDFGKKPEQLVSTSDCLDDHD